MGRYRYAYWWIAALLPLIVVAFWPGYFSDLRGASFAHHVHGIAGSLWLALAALQSWSIATRRFALHAAIGRAVFVVVPLFAAGAALAIAAMARDHTAEAYPFVVQFGARLLPLDLSAMLLFPLLVRDALLHRRRVGRHAAGMLATVLLVLPPMLGRLARYVPGFPPGFEASVHGGELFSALVALWLWSRDRRDGRAFLVVGMVMLLQSLSFEFWDAEMLASLFAVVPPMLFAAIAACGSFVLLWTAWRPVVAKPRAVQTS